MAHRVHKSPSITMHTPLGRLRFTQQFTYNAAIVVPGPDPNPGHINHDDADGTVILAPMPRDDLQTVVEVRAEAPAPTYADGQEGRMVKDPSTALVRIVEPPTSSDSTAGIWRKNKVFAGKIKF